MSEEIEQSGGKASPSLDCSVFVVVVEDRHADVDVEVWTDREAAINRGRELAKKYCRHPDDYEEEQIADWLFYARYSCEDDSIRVIERPIHSPNSNIKES
jgi:hypothetical protein